MLSYVQEWVSGFSPVAVPERLPEGNLNHVWRVEGEERSVIVKHAPPHIASNPEIPLDPSRIAIEARCLESVGPNGSLATLSDETVRPPRLLDANVDNHVILMEDLGDLPTMGRWLQTPTDESHAPTAADLGDALGRFIGRLHATTRGDSECAEVFRNRSMQETRQAVQYDAVAEMLECAGVADAEPLARRAQALGRRLLDPGVCLTMGDLWPRSVMVGDEGLRIIDWELAHYGRPLQDVAHWLAHLWMQKHVAQTSYAEDAIADHRTAFLKAYQSALDPARETLWNRDERRDASVHFAAEILVRAVGPFQDGYVYAGLVPEHPTIREAVSTAVRHLREPKRNSFPAG